MSDASILAIRYAAFAVVATLTNLFIQRLILAWNSNTAGFALAVLAGTASGLIVKYLLDKHWIFMDPANGLKSIGSQFFLYTATGIVTTALFWGLETVFWLTWRTTSMRELGAVIGLTIGYVTKYYLDRRYVFNPSCSRI